MTTEAKFTKDQIREKLLTAEVADALKIWLPSGAFLSTEAVLWAVHKALDAAAFGDTQPEHPEQTGRAVSGSDLIAAERERQIAWIDGEGWSESHDDQHNGGELALAAMVYADPRPNAAGRDPESPELWPFEREAYKPRDYRSNLIRAGALIAAEIDRVQRAQQSPKTGGEG